jgi:hypothetical protein
MYTERGKTDNTQQMIVRNILNFSILNMCFFDVLEVKTVLE